MKEASGGVGFTGLLFLVFLVLKLCKVIDWSWWWVTSPLWIFAGLAISMGLILGIIFVIAKRIQRSKLKKENKR